VWREWNGQEPSGYDLHDDEVCDRSSRRFLALRRNGVIVTGARPVPSVSD
jgi:hypothetical protein